MTDSRLQHWVKSEQHHKGKQSGGRVPTDHATLTKEIKRNPLRWVPVTVRACAPPATAAWRSELERTSLDDTSCPPKAAMGGPNWAARQFGARLVPHGEPFG